MSKYRLPGPRLQHREEWREHTDAYINGYVARCVFGYAVVFFILLCWAAL